jgi:hypothetical protein
MNHQKITPMNELIMRRFAALFLLTVFTVAWALPASAFPLPAKPVRLIRSDPFGS